jgi:hypothetical protein
VRPQPTTLRKNELKPLFGGTRGDALFMIAKKPGITTELRGDTVHELHSTGTRLGILETLAAPMERGRVGMAVPSTGTELFCCLEVSTFSGVVELLAASPLFPREPAIICCMQRADSNFSNSDAHLSLTIHRFMQ